MNYDDKMTKEALVLAASVSLRMLQSYALRSMLWNDWYRMSCSHYCSTNLQQLTKNGRFMGRLHKQTT